LIACGRELFDFCDFTDLTLHELCCNDANTGKPTDDDAWRWLKAKRGASSELIPEFCALREPSAMRTKPAFAAATAFLWEYANRSQAAKANESANVD
jgi:hypothetical protein